MDNVASDVRYVFADLNGYRLGGTRIGTDQTSATIVLRKDDFPPKRTRKQRWPSREQQLSKTKELIEQAWALPMNARITSRMAPLQAMVRIDPDLAAHMSKDVGGQFDYVVQCEIAKLMLQEGKAEGVRLLAEQKGYYQGDCATLGDLRD